MSGKHIVSVGDLVVDLIFPVRLPVMPFQHQDIGGAQLEPGGACNIMIAASRLGAKVTAIGATGGDAFGVGLLKMLADENIDVSLVDAPEDHKSTVVLVLSDSETHQHTFIGHYEGGRETVYTPEVDAIVMSADILLVQGYTLYEQRVSSLVVEAVKRAKAAGIPIYFDAGPSLHIVESDRIDWAVGMVDLIFMTEEEIAGVSGGRTGEEAYEYLMQRGVKTLVVKQGPQGCSIIQADYRNQFPGFQVEVVDTVGAGDSFDAGFMTAQLCGHNLAESALMANAVGAAAVQKRGAGRNVPRCNEVNQILISLGLQFSC